MTWIDKLRSNDPNLQVLDLGTLVLNWSPVGDAEACAIAEALKINSTLHTLNLSYNQVGDEGAQALAEALKVNTTLHILNLSYNPVGPEGGRALAEALLVNSTLHTLHLNQQDPEIRQVIIQNLNNNRNLLWYPTPDEDDDIF